MPGKTIYVYHKNGAESHYYGLALLCKKHHIKLKYREFSIAGKFFKALLKGQFTIVRKQFTNFGFILFLIFFSNQKIVLGIAPFDSKLRRLMWLLKNHRLYYHTSWTCWDKSFHPKNKGNTPKIFCTWKNFLEKKVSHIFAVTRKSKEQLLKNYSLDVDKIDVVYHSLHPAYTTKISQSRTEKSFIYLGRLTADKGLEEILFFAASHPEATFTIIGTGKMEATVNDYATRFPNIHFKGYITEKKILRENMARHQFLILNSKKSTKWEELFGLIIIEAMSQGTLPIAPMHSGPMEIIDPSFGYLFHENEIASTLEQLLAENPFTEEKSQLAIQRSQQYHAEKISSHWTAILNKQ